MYEVRDRTAEHVQPLALKVTRRDKYAANVREEAALLSQLTAAGLVGIPTVVDVTAKGEVVTYPVGTPLKPYMNTIAGTDGYRAAVVRVAGRGHSVASYARRRVCTL